MNTLFYDIETKPNPARVDELFDPAEVKVGNLKDPEKVQQKIAAAKAKAFERAALSPATGEILVIQIALNDGPVEVFYDEEPEMLKRWWEVASENVGRLVNWTGNNSSGNFDANFLVRRSWAYGIEVPYLDGWTNAAKDFLRYADWNSFYSLEKAGAELGFEVQDCAPVTGKTFAKYWDENRPLAMKYAKQDVELLRAIWDRIHPWN